ncbi:uncharacterized protein AMSG_06412 [Thecamonas trahens ATCC 50062]|uniref:Uncharacterized protein n=1 Tax=Thecamonas trahens ATCC 50062 TaxID=461836 RepID=A0A0L0DDF9_THETB|nr:hypothetical protein AMSG_06412 [Thecamonas trahens ATCC 50062]KNC50255.1 hypothetical protein AMSG_06412 [Thecamonas trahens ATCC 50062]|eukprot:XP_013757084.1 hypothetical protein AMSG_06412 [Thecamonas trahens ATCC 50062]
MRPTRTCRTSWSSTGWRTCSTGGKRRCTRSGRLQRRIRSIPSGSSRSRQTRPRRSTRPKIPSQFTSSCSTSAMTPRLSRGRLPWISRSRTARRGCLGEARLLAPTGYSAVFQIRHVLSCEAVMMVEPE